jgi:hypothetical protein
VSRAFVETGRFPDGLPEQHQDSGDHGIRNSICHCSGAGQVGPWRGFHVRLARILYSNAIAKIRDLGSMPKILVFDSSRVLLHKSSADGLGLLAACRVLAVSRMGHKMTHGQPLCPSLASPGMLGAATGCVADRGDSSAVTKGKGHRRRKSSIAKELRSEVTQHARSIARKYRKLFAVDRRLKDRVLRLERALLPPRRGRPRNQTVTSAIALYRKLRRKFPEDKPRATWNRVYPLVIPGYDGMPELEQRTQREVLHERVRVSDCQALREVQPMPGTGRYRDTRCET